MFDIDKQTLTDLNALDWNSSSLLRFFDNTLTLGGRDVLYEWFLSPFNNKEEIIDRQQAITYLATVTIDKLFDKYMMEDLERYLKTSDEFHSPSQFIYYVDKLSSNFLSLTYKRNRLLIKQSVAEVASVLVDVYDVLVLSKKSTGNIGVLRQFETTVAAILQDFDMDELRKVAAKKNAIRVILKYDHIFRCLKKSELQTLFRIVYTLDALSGISKVLQYKEMCFPIIREDSENNNLLQIQGLYNLAIESPVKNDLTITRTKNIWFLTGANMTGKSTLLKSIGSCLYLAQMGFPVPALSMEMPLYGGMMTNINLTDNMESGFSHFFAEVNRIKNMGRKLAQQGSMVIMLDEIFKGTNYQDAYEATLKLIESMTGIENSLFFISTHITDLALVLEKNDRIALKYLATQRHETEGVSFSYKLADGIATEKLGMWFLQRERVFETFQAVKSQIIE